MADEQPRVPLRQRWLNARTMRDHATVEALGVPILAAKPDDQAVRRALARLMTAQGRTSDAEPHWETLLAQSPADLEAAYHVAEKARRGGLDITAAVAQSSGQRPEPFRLALTQAFARPLPMADQGVRHVAICGTSYCGSTLLDRILGGLPGVFSIGESHWLVRERVGNAYAPIDFDRPASEVQAVPCSVCGKNCGVLTWDLRVGLAANPEGWYRKIAARLGTSILISADKNAPKLIEHDPMLDLSALVVFKSPEQAWRSKLNKLPADRDPAYYEAECRTYATVWTRSYLGYLDLFQPQGPVVYLNFDRFTIDPEAALRAVCARLALPFAPGVLSRTEPGHAIGGNAGSMARLRARNYAVEVETLPDPELDPAQAKILSEHTQMQHVYRRLLTRHESSMAMPLASILH